MIMKAVVLIMGFLLTCSEITICKQGKSKVSTEEQPKSEVSTKEPAKSDTNKLNPDDYTKNLILKNTDNRFNWDCIIPLESMSEFFRSSTTKEIVTYWSDWDEEVVQKSDIIAASGDCPPVTKMLKEVMLPGGDQNTKPPQDQSFQGVANLRYIINCFELKGTQAHELVKKRVVI